MLLWLVPAALACSRIELVAIFMLHLTMYATSMTLMASWGLGMGTRPWCLWGTLEGERNRHPCRSVLTAAARFGCCQLQPYASNLLQEGATCELLFFNGKVTGSHPLRRCMRCRTAYPIARRLLLQVLSVEPPAFVELEIKDCPPNVKGNTASGGHRPCLLPHIAAT